MTRILTLITFSAMLVSCGAPAPALLSAVKRSDFQTVVDGKSVDLYTLKNSSGMEMTVTNFGGRVVELFVPDRDGNFVDVVLGHDNVQTYIDADGERFLGATIGRYGNRIAGGKFTLDGIEYSLPVNDGPNTLHGGTKGFDMVVWDADQPDGQTLVLSLVSPAGDQGFPGKLTVTMTYQLTDACEFLVTHEAVTDARTVVNLTHHSFFNLHGAGVGTINDHVLMIAADRFTAVDGVLIPTGELPAVEGTPMDFRNPTPIGARVDAPFEQLTLARGYDHNWVLNKRSEGALELAASVYEPASGRFMEVFTTEPAIQFYGGNFFDGSRRGKGGKPYEFRASLALETQHYPDSPNQPSFPSTILEPGQNYHHVCSYKFSTK